MSNAPVLITLDSRPQAKLSTFSTVVRVQLSTASPVLKAVCGVRIVLLKPISGLSRGSGSLANTSRHAPAMMCSFSAVASA